MFCPYCGCGMVTRNGEVECPAGNMQLSPMLAKQLHESFVARTVVPSSVPLRYSVGGRYYCPGCGVPMITAEDGVQCPRCALHLNAFLHQIIELHSHGGTLDPETGEAIYDGWRSHRDAPGP